MDDQPLPYFFPEALRVIKRLNERERQRGITEKDREFLRNLFFVDADARKAQTPPMIAERLLINLPGHEPVELAGAFMMSSEDAYTPVFFYGPQTGLEKFSDARQLLDTLEKTPAGRCTTGRTPALPGPGRPHRPGLQARRQPHPAVDHGQRI